jgi:hypothetical protein
MYPMVHDSDSCMTKNSQISLKNKFLVISTSVTSYTFPITLFYESMTGIQLSYDITHGTVYNDSI